MAKKKQKVTKAKSTKKKKKVQFRGGSRKKASARITPFSPPKVQGPIFL